MRKAGGERRQAWVLALLLTLGCTGTKVAVEKEIVPDAGTDATVMDSGVMAEVVIDVAAKDSGVTAEVTSETTTLVDLLLDTSPGETTGPEVEVDLAGDGSVQPDVSVMPDNCCVNDADCDEGFRCDQQLTSCIPIPGEGECWYDSDCSEGKSCAWANLCPCQAPDAWSCQLCRIGCDGPDKPGSCVDLYAAGCCLTDEDCNSDNDNDDYQQVCVGHNLGAVADWGVCVLAPVELVSEFPAPPPCWLDDHCNAGESCYGAAICGCFLDCDMAYEGPGFCGPADTDCMPIKEEWVLETCNAANLVIFNGEECVATGFGQCHCGAFCQFTYQNVADCQAVCGGPFPICEVFDGGCDDAIPEQPWWYWDGSNCLKEESCVCEGCPGTFMSLQQCLASCVD